MLGIALGFLLAAAVPVLHQRVFAEDDKKSQSPSKEDAMTQEELARRLDEVIAAQKNVETRLEAVKNLSQTLKILTGK